MKVTLPSGMHYTPLTFALTKRELFAAWVMHGCVSANGVGQPKYWAEACVRMADELLDALAKEIT